MAKIAHLLRSGDRVTIVDRFGKQRTGRAVMRGPHGWVLNMGGKHGTPAIASDDNIVKVSPRKSGKRGPLGDADRRSWIEQHPWMTFFLAGSAISALVAIIRPPAPTSW